MARYLPPTFHLSTSRIYSHIFYLILHPSIHTFFFLFSIKHFWASKFSHTSQNWFHFNRISISVLQLNHFNNKNFHQQNHICLEYVIHPWLYKAKIRAELTWDNWFSSVDVSPPPPVCTLGSVSLFMCSLVYCLCPLLLISSALILCFIASEGVQNVHVAAAALCAHILACSGC